MTVETKLVVFVIPVPFAYVGFKEQGSKIPLNTISALDIKKFIIHTAHRLLGLLNLFDIP